MGLAQKFLITGNTTITPPVYLIKTNQLHTLCITPLQLMITMNRLIANKHFTLLSHVLSRGNRVFTNQANRRCPARPNTWKAWKTNIYNLYNNATKENLDALFDYRD